MSAVYQRPALQEIGGFDALTLGGTVGGSFDFPAGTYCYWCVY